MPKPTIFISYSSKDRPVAETIHGSLESAGFVVWRDKTRLETDWSKEVALGLAKSDLLCLLWSENSRESKWVKHEWLTARALEKLIIPCLLPSAPALPEPLYNFHGISFASIEDGCGNLVDRITERLEKKEGFFEEYEYKLLPKNCSIPFNPNRRFTGRLDDLLDLYLMMVGNLNKKGINQVGTVGMGGIGKTQLAVEFAYRFGFAFHAVYWIQAANPDDWLPGFISIARDHLKREIKDFDKLEGDRQYLFALLHYFIDHPNTLVVMDNVTEPKDLNNDTRLFGFTPLTLRCDLLFTTRRHFDLDPVSKKEIGVLSPDAALHLLRSYRKPKPDEEVHARDICELVGRLPLAVTLAGAYLREYADDYTFESYRNELARKKLHVIDIGKLSEEDLATRHTASVKDTLDDHWKMLRQEDSRLLLCIAGQFPEAAIIPKARLGLLTGITTDPSEIDQPLPKAFRNLHHLCLVERLSDNTNAVRLHPLVREFANQLVTIEEKPQFRTTAAKRLSDALFEYAGLEREVLHRGVEEVISDIQVGLDWWGSHDEDRDGLELLQGALRLSSHALTQSPAQLACQLLGRLMEEKNSKIIMLLDQTKGAGRQPRLRPMSASLEKPGGPRQRTLMHERQVTALVITHDEEHVISGETDGTLTRWEWKSGRPIAKWNKHRSQVRALGVSPDGLFLIVLFCDSWLRVFHLGDGVEAFSVKLGDAPSLLHASVSNNGTYVAFVVRGEEGDQLAMLKLSEKFDSCQEIFRFTEPDIRALAVTAKGEKLFWAIGQGDRGILKILNVVEGMSGSRLKPAEVDFEYREHGHDALAVSPDGTYVVFKSFEGPFLVWDFSRGRDCRLLEAGRGDLLLAVTPDGKRGISTDKGGFLILWDLERLSKVAALAGHTNLVHSVSITADGYRALSAGGDNTVNVWDLKNIDESLPTDQYHPARAITSLALSMDCQLVAAGSWNGEIKIWHVQSAGPTSPPLSVDYGPIRKMLFLPDDRLLAISEGNTVCCDLKTMTCGESIFLHGGWPLAIAANGRRVVLLLPGKIEVFDLVSQVTLYAEEIDVYTYEPTVITSEEKAVFWAEDGMLRVFDMEQRRFLPSINVDGGRVSSLGLLPDGKRTILGFEDGTIRLYALDDPASCETLTKKHTHKVRSVAIAPNGYSMVSCSADRTLVVWDLLRKEAVADFTGDSPLDSCAVTSDGRTIIAGERTGRLHFLRLDGVENPVLQNP